MLCVPTPITPAATRKVSPLGPPATVSVLLPAPPVTCTSAATPASMLKTSAPLPPARFTGALTPADTLTVSAPSPVWTESDETEARGNCETHADGAAVPGILLPIATLTLRFVEEVE